MDRRDWHTSYCDEILSCFIQEAADIMEMLNFSNLYLSLSKEYPEEKSQVITTNKYK